MKVYSIRDCKAEIYALPFLMPNDLVAGRAVARAVNDPESDLHHHTEDYSLFVLGEFDQSSGLLHTHIPKFVLQCTSLREALQNASQQISDGAPVQPSSEG